MLCGLSIVTGMRAIPFTHGETEKCKRPQPWVQGAMYWAVYAVLAQALCVIAILTAIGSGQVQVG